MALPYPVNVTSQWLPYAMTAHPSLCEPTDVSLDNVWPGTEGCTKSPWQQELLKNCKNWLRWWINIFHVNKHSPAIPCLISLFFFSTPDLKLKTNEFVYDGMLCFPLNPYHWYVVLFTVLPTSPRFGFCMHNFWISPMGCVACCIRPIFFYQCVCWLLFKIWT